MDISWNNNEQQARFLQLWEREPSIARRHTKEVWDVRAESWESGLREDAGRRQRSERRIAATVSFLRSHGLLGSDCDVIDIGCGPGRFAAEFAKTAHYVAGTDLSPKMVEYAARFSREQGLANTAFTACDFKAADIDQYGWRNRFDLVFISITPAVSDKAGLEKAMSMSRGWCFNAGFLSSRDELLSLVSREVFGREYGSRWDGCKSYALFNLLWLWGWTPYVSYYTEKSMDRYVPDRALAATLAENLGISPSDQGSIDAVYRYLEERAGREEAFSCAYESEYIWLLWNLRDRRDRASYEAPPSRQRGSLV